ncbi:MAG: phosphate signaling complex protein PhoU [Oligoflexia bacterium]|nr:phosphate signaling complex protein PhoU [Oligoflexia bacterium]
MKRQFDNELQELKVKLLEMATLTETAIRNSVNALLNKNENMAGVIIENDREIDKMELLIDELCIDLLVRRQPLAIDFRLITMGLKFNSELERIADLAVNISERVIDISHNPEILLYTEIKKFSLLAIDMLKNAIDSFVHGDVALAERVICSDQEANNYRDSIQKELVENYLYKNRPESRSALSLFLVAQHLERICDHVTYIAEDVIYFMTARVVKHNRDSIYNK